MPKPNLCRRDSFDRVLEEDSGNFLFLAVVKTFEFSVAMVRILYSLWLLRQKMARNSNHLKDIESGDKYGQEAVCNS